MTIRSFLRAVALALVAPVFGCGDNQDPQGADALWHQIHDLNYRGFSRAPGYEVRRDSNAPHGGAVDIYVNATVRSALDARTPLTEWPAGSLIVKDGWDGDENVLVAAMEKRADGWYWAEWNGEGTAKYSGKPDLCIDCHSSGADHVRAFPFPR